MKEDTPDLATIGLPNGARSLKVGSAAGNWEVFPENHYGGVRGYVKQGLDYSNPQQMGLQRNQPVRSLRKPS